MTLRSRKPLRTEKLSTINIRKDAVSRGRFYDKEELNGCVRYLEFEMSFRPQRGYLGCNQKPTLCNIYINIRHVKAHTVPIRISLSS